MVRRRLAPSPWTVAVLLVVPLLALGPAATTALLQALGDFLVIRDPLAPADAVIAVSGDGIGERVQTAVRLLQEGYGRWLILSGSTAGRAPGGATAAMLRAALREGVPGERILVDDGSVSTRDNARHSAALMESHGLRRAILVTSPYHTRRAAWVFRSEFRTRELQVRVFAVPRSFFDPHRWWTRPQARRLVLREYGKWFRDVVGLE